MDYSLHFPLPDRQFGDKVGDRLSRGFDFTIIHGRVERTGMTSESMPVGVILERREIDNPWESHSWTPVGVVPGAADLPDWKEVAKGEGWVQFYAGTLSLELNRDETEDYRYNLANDPPSVYVLLREDEDVEAGIAPFKLTVSPSEAQAYLDGDELLLEPVPMPEIVKSWLAAFIERYHVDQPVYKRTRKPYDPRKGGPPQDGTPAGAGRRGPQ
ncbi:MAG: hypothetical protein ACI9MJ_002072 [Alphaproteobacteria bacterium]|jgi:hypothetical protein